MGMCASVYACMRISCDMQDKACVCMLVHTHVWDGCGLKCAHENDPYQFSIINDALFFKMCFIF